VQRARGARGALQAGGGGGGAAAKRGAGGVRVRARFSSRLMWKRPLNVTSASDSSSVSLMAQTRARQQARPRLCTRDALALAAVVAPAQARCATKAAALARCWQRHACRTGALQRHAFGARKQAHAACRRPHAPPEVRFSEAERKGGRGLCIDRQASTSIALAAAAANERRPSCDGKPRHAGMHTQARARTASNAVRPHSDVHASR
jgi:hypothetical protein